MTSDKPAMSWRITKFMFEFMDITGTAILAELYNRQKLLDVEKSIADQLMLDTDFIDAEKFVESEAKEKLEKFRRVVKMSAKVLADSAEAGEFVSRSLFCRVMDSFEFYLKSLCIAVLAEHPDLMKGKDGEQDMKLEITAILENKKALKYFLAEQYVRRFDRGAGYKSYYKIFRRQIDKKVLTDEFLSLLDELFRVRNKLTHENQPLSKKDLRALNIRIGGEPNLEQIDIRALSLELFKFCLNFEKHVHKLYFSSKYFTKDISDMPEAFLKIAYAIPLQKLKRAKPSPPES